MDSDAEKYEKLVSNTLFSFHFMLSLVPDTALMNLYAFLAKIRPVVVTRFLLLPQVSV
jgi:hypothetical protein